MNFIIVSVNFLSYPIRAQSMLWMTFYKLNECPKLILYFINTKVDVPAKWNKKIILTRQVFKFKKTLIDVQTELEILPVNGSFNIRISIIYDLRDMCCLQDYHEEVSLLRLFVWTKCHIQYVGVEWIHRCNWCITNLQICN